MSSTDLLTKLQDILSFLKEQNARGTVPIQLKILLRSKTKEVSLVLNAFLGDTDQEPDEKLETTVDALGLVNDIQMTLPRHDLFEIPRMKYSAISNFLRNYLVQSFSYSNIARNYSTASILSNLLIEEINHIDELPELPPYQNPEKFNRTYGPVFNTIVSTCGVYTSLISVLPIANKEDVDEWFGYIFKYMELFEEIRSRFNILALLGSKKVREPDKLLLNAYNIANTHFTMLENLIQCFQIYDTDFPEHLKNSQIIVEGDLSDFQRYMDNVLKLNEKIENQINQARNNRLLSLNIDISDSPFYKHFLMNCELVKSQRLIIELYQNNFQNLEEILPQLVNHKLDRMNKFVDMVGNKEELVKSSAISSVLPEFKDILPFAARQAVENRDEKLFYDILTSWEILFDNYSYEQANELALLLLLSKLYVNTHLGIRIDFYQISKEIEENIHYLSLRPRLYVAMSIIRIIADSYTGKIGQSLPEIINEIEEIGTPEGYSWYAEELEQYIEYLKKGGDISNLKYRNEIIALDTYSWLIPNFSNKMTSTGRKLIYLPFNRRKDRLV